MNFEVFTTLPLETASVDLYLRHGPAGSPVARNNFSIDPQYQPETRIKLSQRALRLHPLHQQGFPDVDVALERDRAHDAWVGMMHRGDWRGQVVLRRVNLGTREARSMWVGTWISPDRGGSACLHIGQVGRELTAWVDNLQNPVTLRYANGIKPAPLLEQYGSLSIVSEPEAGMISWGGQDSGICCAQHFFARARPGGQSMQVTGTAVGAERWLKVRGGRCR